MLCSTKMKTYWKLHENHTKKCYSCKKLFWPMVRVTVQFHEQKVKVSAVNLGFNMKNS